MRRASKSINPKEMPRGRPSALPLFLLEEESSEPGKGEEEANSTVELVKVDEMAGAVKMVGAAETVGVDDMIWVDEMIRADVMVRTVVAESSRLADVVSSDLIVV